MAACPACGHENPAEARFCNACAAPLTAAPETRREERKIVTVLFADLVGFTSRAERLDPEDVRALLAPYWERLRGEIERFGGTVEKFIGDAVMALFGAPIAHEDDPYRAVRAALAIRDWVRESGEELQARIAVNTGEALVLLGARPSEGEGMAAGDVVNTAARLQSAAPVNGILVGETTYRATRDLIEYEEREPVVAKGKAEPLPVWEALDTRSRIAVEIVPTGELVGRKRELELLAGALERARSEREPQLVTVSGVPGIGKSRLVGELFGIVEADEELITWRQGRSLSYGEGVSFWALGEIVKAEVGVLGSDSREAGEEKLAPVLADLLPEGEREWVAAHLRPLLGLAADEARGGEDRSESFAAWRRFLEALAERRPTVLVFEDLQWADDALLDFVDELPEWVAGVPLLVVCTTRPELFERRPGWSGGKRNALAISLGPLSDEETARIVAVALESPLMDAAKQAAVLARAGGNPLYAEQYARMVTEGLGADAELPETVQGIIAARIDLLAPDEKALLQDASVMGRLFWPSAIDASEDRLHALVRKEFIRRERRSSIEGESEYAFAHALVRDVAYSQIPRSARFEKHRRAAEWIETLPPDRAADRADLLAHHYTSALELGAAAGLDTSALVEPARFALREAGDRALALNAFQAAERHYSAALDLSPGEDERARLLLARGRSRMQVGGDALADFEAALAAAADVELIVEAETAAAEKCWYLGDRDAADAHAERALALVADLEPSRAKADALTQRARLLMLAGDHQKAIETATLALELSESLGLEHLQASALITRGTTAGGDSADLLRGIEIAERVKDAHQVNRGLNNLAESSMRAGALSGIAGIYARMRAEAEQYGSRNALHWLDAQECAFQHACGDWDAATAFADTVIAQAEADEGSYMEAQARSVRAMIDHARGGGEAAVAEAARSAEAARRLKDPQAVGPSVAVLALLLARERRVSEAAALVDELLAACRERGQVGYYTWAPDLTWAAVELGRERELIPVMRYHAPSPWVDAPALACAGDFVGASAMLRDCGAETDAAEASLYAAQRLLEAGDRAGADEQLALARAFYRRVGATERMRIAESLLAATA